MGFRYFGLKMEQLKIKETIYFYPLKISQLTILNYKL